MPPEATWEDYVAVHGGPDAAGWWVTLCWYGDSTDPRPEVVGPYTSYGQAIAAMQDCLLIDSFCEDTQRSERLDDVYVSPQAASISSMCAEFGSRVTLIDPGDPHHHGGPDVTDLTPAAPDSAVLQASSFAETATRQQGAPPLDATAPVVHSPGAPSV